MCACVKCSVLFCFFLYCCYASKFLFCCLFCIVYFITEKNAFQIPFLPSRNLFGTLRHIQCWYSCTDHTKYSAGNSSSHSSLVPRPHSLDLRVWWLLSDFSVVLSQQSWFGQSNEIAPCHPSVHIKQWNGPYIMQACNQCSKSILLSPHNQEIPQ